MSLIASSEPQNRRDRQSSEQSEFGSQPETQELKRIREAFAERSVFTSEYQALLRLLRQARREAGLTQVQLGERLGQPQAIISKCERGERRLDVIELRAYCCAIGISYLRFLEKLEGELK